MKTIFGVFALNELRALRRIEGLVPRNAVFIVDGNDGSLEFLRSRGRKILHSEKRRGKAGAMADFLSYCRRIGAEIAVPVQADTLPNREFFSEICAPIEKDPSVGISVAKIAPIGSPGFSGFFGKLNWEMHNRFCERGRTKAGEIAIRIRAVKNPAPWIINEDAFLQSESERAGYKTVYFPRAIVKIGTPESLYELVSQRRRIAAGHFQLISLGRNVSTASPIERLSVFLEVAPKISGSPADVIYSALAPLAELFSVALGFFDWAFGRANPFWEPLESTKVSFSGLKYNKFKKN